MNTLVVRRSVRCIITTQVRSFVKVGDAVPVNYMKDEKPPVIMEDKEYPEWLKDVAKQGAPKEVLMKKFETTGVESMTALEMRRLKRQLTKEEIKEFNMNKVLEKSD